MAPGWALLAGLLWVAASDGWLAERFLFGQWMSADFADYCLGILSNLQNAPDLWPTKRSRLAGWLPSVLAGPLGILLEGVPAVRKRPPVQGRVVPMAAGGICLLLIHGVGSTPLSVHATWRRPWSPVGSVFRFHPDSPALSLAGGEAACLAEITRDGEKGRWLPVSPDRRHR